MLSFAPKHRFDVVRPLGQGGMGEVFEAFDREEGAACAIKLLRVATPQALLRFKHEFRALQGLAHPNLIALGELLSEEDRWFFTMELVRGVDFLAHVRDEDGIGRAPTAHDALARTWTLAGDAPLRAAELVPACPPRSFDEARLRAALAQLSEGLRFLHDAGRVHRDVKPSNVLVTGSGRVVLLDFGLVAESSAGAPDERGVVCGTPAYMAPEQAQGGPVGPAADLYAVGVMLFEALTGATPYADCSLAGLLTRGIAPVPRPSDRVAGISPALDDLCVQLLAPAPGARPSPRDVLARLGTAEVPEAPEAAAPFVGRAAELDALASACADSLGESVLVALEGPSGIGKTALMKRLLEGRGEGRPLVLWGRCYEHEGIPYKAIDAVMDALARHLASEWSAEALPANASLLGVLFPVLGRLGGFARAAGEVADAHRMRRDAEQGGRALFRALAARRPLIVAIDDFQWADADSRTFLSALARAPDAPPFLLLLASRGEVSLPFDGPVRRIAVAPLPAHDARALATSLLARSGSPGCERAASIADEAGGHPLFMSELALRASPLAGPGTVVRLDDVLWQRIQEREGAARQLLELVAVAAAPLPQSVAAEAAGLEPASFARAARELRAERLVRTSGIRASDDVEAYHDRIRETVVARLGDAERTAWHLRLARSLERQRPDDLDALVTHYDGGGDGDRAARYAIMAGDRARGALAFERAASFYRHAIARLPAGVCRAERLHWKLGEALANAGIGAQAAAAFERAAEHAEPDQVLELRRRAAELLLSSGRLDEGLAALRAVLGQMAVRMPKRAATSFASLLFHRARVGLRGFDFAEAGPGEVDPAELVRIDALWAAAARLGPVDTIRAADFQARHLLASLELGEPFRVARALLAESCFVAMGGPARWSKTEALLSRARAIVGRIHEPYATAMMRFADGFAAFQAGRYRRALEELDAATDLFRTTCTGASADAAVAQRFVIDSLYNLGQLAELRRRVPVLLEDAERRGDFYLSAELRTGLPNVMWLCTDRPEEARRANELGIAHWPRATFLLQHYYHMLAAGQIALYLGDGEGAHRAVEAAWPGLKKSLLLGIQAVNSEAVYLRARAAIAAHRFDIANDAIASLARHTIPAATGLAGAARACLAARSGDTPQALALLASAERALVGADLGMYAAACRFQRARLRGEAPGEVERAIHAAGVDRPDRFADMLLPGFGPRS